MDDLITLALRFGIMLLASPFLVGVALALTALYGVGSDWPIGANAALGGAALALWGFAAWRFARNP